MKKHFLLILALWVCQLDGFAKHVPADSAQKVALQFLQQLAPANFSSRSSSSLTLVHQEVSKASSPSGRVASLTYYYVFALNDNGGLVFVSADDKVVPILGYTNKGAYAPENMPPHFIKWLENYKSEIRYAIQEMPENEESVQLWKDLLEGEKKSSGARIKQAAIEPLMSTTWDQAPYYNDLCPIDNEYGEKTVTGCVATAMAQIMKYWEYPAKGSGFHSYNHEKYGTISANFSNTTYNWNDMPNNLSGPNQSVATLMQHIGVSVEMGYDVAENGGSGAYIISAESPVVHCSEYALKTYFGYDGAQGKRREDYTATSWAALLKGELDAGRPILYAGYGGGGGHAFVCDGYDTEGNFHMNWGWGGYYDGFYAISALNPGGVGTGGGTGGYNTGHQAVIGIQAEKSSPTEEFVGMELYDHVYSSASMVSYGQAFSVTTDIWNSGTAEFQGDFGAAAFDEDGNFVDWIQIISGQVLEAGYYFDDVSFETEGMLTLLPGSYSIGVFVKSGNGQWEQLTGGGYTDFVTLSVSYDNIIELSSALSVANVNQLYQGKEISVTTSLKNKGNSAFSGGVAVALYNLDGSHVFTIDEKEVTNLCGGCTSDPITFQTQQNEVEPGSYLLAVLHVPETAEEWELTGIGEYANPLKVVVQVAPLAGDNYEDNDEVEKAFDLPLALSGTTTSFQLTTPGSNIHVGTDYDYYKISLPEGYRYTLDARVHDSHNSTDQNTYSNDVLVSFWNGEEWSDAYDDVLPAGIEVEGGNTVYFYVSPYFQGETGTYLLDLKIRKGKPTGIGDDLPVMEVSSAYPNPTSGILNLRIREKFEQADLTSLTGQKVKELPANVQQVDMSDLPNGIYLLRIKSKEGFQVQKVVKE